jgi:hypothetical protein
MHNTKNVQKKYLILMQLTWWGNLRELYHWGDQGVNGRIILRWIFRRWDAGVWTGLSWVMIGTCGGHL